VLRNRSVVRAHTCTHHTPVLARRGGARGWGVETNKGLKIEDFINYGGFDGARSTTEAGYFVHILYRTNQVKTRDLLEIYQRTEITWQRQPINKTKDGCWQAAEHAHGNILN